jgi:predicted nuclease with TOPRIM domain
MDRYIRQNIKRLASLYFDNKENALIELTEINQDYQDLFPIIRKVVEERMSHLQEEYNEIRESHDKLEKKEEKYDELIEKLKEIKKDRSELDEINLRLDKNKKELTDILNEE